MSLTEAHLERRLQAATNSQDSIQTLSLWLLHHRVHHQKIIRLWMKVFKKAKIVHRLTLLYLANDVIQNSKRKNITVFRDSFSEVLKEATALVRDDQVCHFVSRIFNIWSERNIFSSDFVSELQAILSDDDTPDSTSKLVADFKCEKVAEKLRLVSKLEVETAAKEAKVHISKFGTSNAEIVQRFKDRTHGQQFSSEFDDTVRCLEDVIKSLTKEIEERNALISLLGQSDVYYDTQRGEVKMVTNAYKNFGSRVKTLQKRLEEVAATFPLPSPIPSPCPDAPSPTTSDLEAELELPSEDVTSETGDEDRKAVSVRNSASESVAAFPICMGKPIPIVSSFLPQDIGKMSSWLNSFPEKKSSSVEVPDTLRDGDSLDSRLSSLLQKIPNLSGSMQNAIFRTSLAPARGESSGQNTPLQDEDASNSVSSRLFIAHEASHSSKDISKEFKTSFPTAGVKDHDSNVQVAWQSKKKGLSSKEVQPVQTFLPPPPFFFARNLSPDLEKNRSFQQPSTSTASMSSVLVAPSGDFETNTSTSSQDHRGGNETRSKQNIKSTDYSDAKRRLSGMEYSPNSKQDVPIPLVTSSCNTGEEAVSQARPSSTLLHEDGTSKMVSSMQEPDDMDITNETKISSGNSLSFPPTLSEQGNDWICSNIETVESSRNIHEGQPFLNEYDIDYRQGFPRNGPFNQRFNRNSHHNFQKNGRHSSYNNRPKRFFSGRRRRGWIRHSHPY